MNDIANGVDVEDNKKELLGDVKKNIDDFLIILLTLELNLE
ncbi:hypothetical protein Q5M85_12510 [Paraclostridium bifermentans]|nr:hypothetical protein [Paraclostridium bifermentans]